MTLSFVVRRALREWRQLGVLAIALCLVTAFFALGPMYVRAMVQSGLQALLSNKAEQNVNLTLTSQTAYRPDTWDLVTGELGPLTASVIRIARSGTPFGGFDFTYGESTTEATPRSPFGYYVYAFSNLRSVLTLTDGRWPERLPVPDSPERKANTPEEQITRGVGKYSRGDVECVITAQVARQTGYQVGTRFVVGERPASVVVVHVVGIVQATVPDDPMWTDNQFALEGELVQRGIGQQSYNAAFIIPEGAYADWMAKATTRVQGGDNNSYLWQIALKPQAINADNVQDVQTRLTRLANRLTTQYPGLIIFNPLSKLLNGYTSQASNALGPVVLLSGGVLLLMLYHLVTTVSLALEQQQSEWASFASRGASAWQLIVMQVLTMGLLGLIGFLTGPYLARLILQGLANVGPLATGTAGASGLSNLGIPADAFTLSAVAAIAAVIALILPAIPAARRSLAQFKQIASRPPDKPTWVRYRLDLIACLVGIGFVARLLFFVSGDLRQTLVNLLNDPRQLIQLILDSANRSGGLGDPLNLIGPALLLTGVALLWLRLFRLIMRLVARIAVVNNHLTGPLAAWNVERDPGHYSQLVLLLIGTLALGTAALALGTTRDFGTWTAARAETGGAARLDFVPGTALPSSTELAALPGVSTFATLTRFRSTYKTGRYQVFLAGFDPADMSRTFPELAETLAPLIGQNVDSDSGSVPVIMSARMAADEGRAVRQDRLPLTVGMTGETEILLPDDKTMQLPFRIVGIARAFPSLAEDQHFLLMDSSALQSALSPTLARLSPPEQIAPNQVWLELPARLPDARLYAALNSLKGLSDRAIAWDRYTALLREPLPAAIAGMLFAGFCVSLLLSLLDFGYYLAVTARRRLLSFAVLQALGWNANHLWALLAAEQAVLVLPAVLIGTLLGAALAYVILPFLALVGGVTLQIPLSGLLMLVLALLFGFGVLLLATALYLRRMNVNQVLRLGEE